jgi:menaquinone-dependent protoporphyrinogen oxidase
MRVLVVYGSTRGGTAGLAHMVADAFAMRGISTEVRRAGDVRDLTEADAVVVGGGLYSNRWHPEAVAFVGRHRAALQQLPVWFFSSGPLDDSARAGSYAAVPQVSALAREVDIRGHMTFGGLLDKRPSGLLGLFAWGPQGDFRDRQHVAEWVERIAADLHGETAPTVRVIGGTKAPATVLPLPQPVPFSKAEPPPEAEPEQAPVPEPDKPKRPQLRRYLRLEDDADDEGLDLFDGVS